MRYNAQARQVPDAIRQSVIERDGGKCQSCGNAGSEIDHIKGDRSILENLQLLCADCRRQKTMRNFERITADEHPELWAKAAARTTERWPMNHRVSAIMQIGNACGGQS